MGMSVKVTRRCLAALIGLTAACVSLATSSAQGGVSANVLASTPDARQTRRWQLRRGVPVHTQLQGWAASSDWTLDWRPRVSWIEGLFFEGKPVRLVLWQGNHLAEVVSSDAR